MASHFAAQKKPLRNQWLQALCVWSCTCTVAPVTHAYAYWCLLIVNWFPDSNTLFAATETETKSQAAYQVPNPLHPNSGEFIWFVPIWAHLLLSMPRVWLINTYLLIHIIISNNIRIDRYMYCPFRLHCWSMISLWQGDPWPARPSRWWASRRSRDGCLTGHGTLWCWGLFWGRFIIDVCYRFAFKNNMVVFLLSMENCEY